MLSIIGPVWSRKRKEEEHKNIISYKKARNKSYNDTSLLLFLFYNANLIQQSEEEIYFYRSYV